MKLFFIFVFLSLNVHAKALLKDVGVVGLMSHDIFAWDRVNEVNTENGRLDLSTIFDYDGGSRWQKGGNPKNAENSPVYSITMQLVRFYKKTLKTDSPEVARKKTVVHFQAMIKDSFERLSGLEFPTHGVNANVTNTEQASLRGMHDILPGRAKLYGRPLLKEFALTNPLFAKLQLNERELNQELKDFDGDYDYEYQHIKIPFSRKEISLKKVDADFIAKFSPYTQEAMLAELAQVGRSERDIQSVFFMQHVFELVQKAICSTENRWMPQEINCF